MPTKGEIQWIDGVYDKDPLWAKKQPDPVSINIFLWFVIRAKGCSRGF